MLLVYGMVAVLHKPLTRPHDLGFVETKGDPQDRFDGE